MIEAVRKIERAGASQVNTGTEASSATRIVATLSAMHRRISAGCTIFLM